MTIEATFHLAFITSVTTRLRSVNGEAQHQSLGPMAVLC